MCKNNFKILLLMTLIAVCFASSLFSMQEVADKQIAESSLLSPATDNAFIKEFAKKINNPKVKYDGKTLRLYMDTSSSMKGPLIFTATCLFLGIGCLIKSNDGRRNLRECLDAFGAICILFGVASGFYIYVNMLTNLFFKKFTPFLSIDSEQIEARNNIKIKWTDASIMKFLSDNSIMLCDKDGIPLFVIDNNNLPIKLSELIVILGFYFKKYGAKDKDLHD